MCTSSEYDNDIRGILFTLFYIDSDLFTKLNPIIDMNV